MTLEVGGPPVTIAHVDNRLIVSGPAEVLALQVGAAVGASIGTYSAVAGAHQDSSPDICEKGVLVAYGGFLGGAVGGFVSLSCLKSAQLISGIAVEVISGTFETGALPSPFWLMTPVAIASYCWINSRSAPDKQHADSSHRV